MDKSELVKYAQLDLLIELDRICKKNGINYFLVGGTLIGAIRHNGFIPWDDDIDVGMLRADYEKFEKACEKDLNPEYAKYDWHIDSASPLPFLKLKIKGTHYREYFSKDSNMNDAIFIDIFPYELNTGKVIIETIEKLGYDPMAIPGIVVKNHGPFAWGTSPTNAVYNAVVMEKVAEMDIKTLLLNPQAEMKQYVLDKHYMRKHGPNAYYGQK